MAVKDGSSEQNGGHTTGARAPFVQASERMREAGLPVSVIKNFENLFSSVRSGDSGVISEEEIEPLQEIESLAAISASLKLVEIGKSLLGSLDVVRLNGGLGTTMGLNRAKSLLVVKEELTFNDIIAKQLLTLGRDAGVHIPLLHMTSFSTDSDIRSFMEQYPELSYPGLPTTFQQHKHPKIYVDTMLPAAESDDDLNWNPPGHGDMYSALLESGIAARLLELGKRYLFVANADNLGATVDPCILGYLADQKAPFLMETAERTAADSKGGHLARRRATGRLLLRESGQAPTTPSGDLIPQFRDTAVYRHFNTNNIWLDLEAVVKTAKEHEGIIPLPLISNRKTVNPRDRSSRKVIQIETAMGAAIEVFDGACALQVPRTRFAPVKSNNDLLVVRSDAYELNPSFNLIPRGAEGALPTVQLDPHYFGLLADFETRMKVVPSLREARALVVKGDVLFDHPVKIVGSVTIAASGDAQGSIPAEIGSLQDQELLV
jgi:UTP--glucose-1-phosphate uridylyltransferase